LTGHRGYSCSPVHKTVTTDIFTILGGRSLSKFEEKVIDKIRERAEVGKAKYGVTMERSDLDTIEWLTHLQEELMDASVYVERLLEEVGKLQKLL
tara:strand:+ start:83 stop:367 length:285 start_codon:yes stop_codon:yes gene_type:complete